MEIVRLSLPFGQLIPNICCPICGTDTQEVEDESECPHLLFSYFDMTSEFLYVRPDIEELKEKAESEAEEGDGYPPELLAGMINSKSAVCFAVTGSGMACGPVSYTSYVAVDFAEADEE